MLRPECSTPPERRPVEGCTLTIRFDSAQSRDEFLHTHIDWHCSDIVADVTLVGPDPRRDGTS